MQLLDHYDIGTSESLASTAMTAVANQVHTTFPLDAPLIVEENQGLYNDFLHNALSEHNPNPVNLITSIPCPLPHSYGPLAVLSALLSALPGPWPVLELQQAYSKLWRMLPEDAKSGRGSSQAQQLLERAFRQCKHAYTSLLDLLHPLSTSVAIIDPETGHAWDHGSLATVIRNFSLPISIVAGHPKPVIAISLPNGPLLAMTVLATATYYTAAPVAYGSGVGAEQFKSDVLQSNSDMVIVSQHDISRLGLRESWLAEAGIRVVLVELDADTGLAVRDLDGSLASQSEGTAGPVPNHSDDTGILLFTSGTSGTKKLVPLSIHSLVCGVAMVVESWGLSTSMRCLNQMPLNHVGGLIRNLFAPLMSGGSVICCSAFDANLFWDCVEDHLPTWYYASPSMHQCILEAGAERPESMAKSQIKLVCNAAGGLLPSLALQLRDVFSSGNHDCTVLPSYGMTECMPISTPPLDYRLERTGTSGISVGPDIAIFDEGGVPVEDSTVGRINVRGAPVFGGYLKANNAIDKTCFTEDGWFDTGDLGYLDNAGYLYITGRSKEVINRGGELISPFEIEEAVIAAAQKPHSPTFGRVGKALAFSVMHSVLQEVVGVCVVTPPGSNRPCLRQIQRSLKNTLAQAKIPVLIVYMDNGLPMNNNKVLRIKLAERLRLPAISDDTSHGYRHYEAICPPPNTSLSSKIACTPLQVTHANLQFACKQILSPGVDVYCYSTNFYPELVLAPKPGLRLESSLAADSVIEKLAVAVHGYDLPSKVLLLQEPFPRTSSGGIDRAVLGDILNGLMSQAMPSAMSPTETTISFIFADILSQSARDLSPVSDFFSLGGDSMKAGRLLSCLRKEFQLRLPIDVLFANRQISALASLIDKKTAGTGEVADDTPNELAMYEELLPGCEVTHSSTNPLLLLLQLVPLCILYPMKRAFTWTIFLYCLSYTQRLITNKTILGRLTNLVVSMFIARTLTRTIVPIMAIIMKWIVIGRYKEGLYPMWGRYHTRWWICQKAIQVAGMGTWNTFNWTRCLYFRSMGASIGTNVVLNKGVTLGEYDLLEIEDGVVLERCIVRPFAVERNTSMYLGRIKLGSCSSIGLGSIVAAGACILPNTCLGPNSSSWEHDDADEANRDLAASRIEGAHWALNLIVGLPLQTIAHTIGALPWLGCLTVLVNHEPKAGAVDEFRQITLWFASPERVGLHYAALATNAALGPGFFFLSVLTIKKFFDVCCAKLQAGGHSRLSQMTKFRMQLIRSLMPAPRFHKLTGLFGTHYETTSILMRAMGAKIGTHVYWPGTGPSIQDYHLIEVGDDVVFGSRSHIVTSDGIGSDYIRIKSGAMVADRVALLPGVELGEKTVMGSGALTKRNTAYPAATTWVGSKRGGCVCLTASAEKELASVASLFSYNSSSTTLARHLDSETSSIAAVEKASGLAMYEDRGILKSGSNLTIRNPAVRVRFADHEASADSKLESSSPFGRAFYQGQAPYRVWTQFEIFFYCTFLTIMTAIYWNIGSISALQVVARIFKDHDRLSKTFLAQTWFRPLTLFILFSALTISIMTVQSIIVLLFLVAAKWVLIGRRRSGCYSWDVSPYCQRWQLYLNLESFRRHCYGGNGILGMLTGTHWIVLYFRALGANIGKDCALFAGGLPSLMFTEPDLVTLGNRVAVDDASLVGHINTRGKFDLNPLHVGDRSVLRSGSRLLSGARMEADTCLLEHTLVMAGDVVDAGCTSQGWPAEEFKDSRMPTMMTKQIWTARS